MWRDNETSAGFMNDSIAAEPSRAANTVVVGGEDRTRITMPVSLSQVAKLTRPDEGLLIHGRKISVVTVVGRIVEILESSPHKLQYMIDDYTNGGPLEITFIRSDAGLPSNDPQYAMFNNDGRPINPDESSTEQFQINDYIRVYGQVKFSGDRAQIMAYKLVSVVDPNEITMHILEVVRETMYAEKCESGVVPLQSNTKQPMIKPAVPQSGEGYTGINEKVNNAAKHIMRIIKSSPNETKHINDIVAALRGVQRSDIEEALRFLSTEGHLWNGDNEDIWCGS